MCGAVKMPVGWVGGVLLGLEKILAIVCVATLLSRRKQESSRGKCQRYTVPAALYLPAQWTGTTHSSVAFNSQTMHIVCGMYCLTQVANGL